MRKRIPSSWCQRVSKCLMVMLVIGFLFPNQYAIAFNQNSFSPILTDTRLEYQDDNPVQQVYDRLYEFQFPGIGEEMNRTIQVYLPIGYTRENNYPVLYLHDGGILFNPPSGQDCMLDETLTDLQESGQIGDGIIVVGIFSTENRWDEYSPYVNTNMHYWEISTKAAAEEGGSGDAYVKYVNRLIEYIDSNYSTIKSAEGRAIGGFSMGGLISLYAGLKKSNKFSKVIAMSPAVWFAETDTDDVIGNHNQLVDEIKAMKVPQDVKIYIDIGKNEWPGREQGNYSYPKIWEDGAVKLYQVLRKRVPPENLLLLIDNNGKHDGFSWANRFGPAILWLYEDIIPINDRFEIRTPAASPIHLESDVSSNEDSDSPEQQLDQQTSNGPNIESTSAPVISIDPGKKSVLDKVNYDNTFFTVVAVVLLIIVVVLIWLLIKQLQALRKKP